MASKLFVTGVSGYIGGQFLHDITKKHPEYQIRALVRNVEQQVKVAAQYPFVHIVVGDLDSAEPLKEEAAKADVVLHLADADHVPAITTLLGSIPKASTYIHLSGAASIWSASSGVGEADPRIWSDTTDLDEITSFDTSIIHAIPDQLVISEGKKNGVRTALVLPPVVVGRGEGPLKKLSMTLPWYVDLVKKRGWGFKVGKGGNIHSMVHVRDLSAALILLVEEALKDGGGSADWGQKGVYYIESESNTFADVATELIKEMVKQNIISSADVEELDTEEVKKIHPWGHLVWGYNMRIRGERIEKLGWKVKEGDVFETIPELFS